MANKNLQAAKAAKKDEFYTQLTDIEDELSHYKAHFQGKTVICNCDDPRVSNFYKYFKQSFNHLGLKRLICTCYKNQDVDLFSQQTAEQAVYIDYTGGEEKILPLKGDGDFRSQECIELLKQADIVCTNPPFSLFREYVAQLMKYEKKFLILGPSNALHYKEIFPFIQENKAWIGFKSMSKDMLFGVPYEFEQELRNTKKEGSGWKIVNGKFLGRAIAIWFTNLDHQKRHEDIPLFRKINQFFYDKYENIDAIDIKNIADIPEDYFGLMGVPDSFLNNYNPMQFEILGLLHGNLGVKAGIRPYDRALKKLNNGLRDGDPYYMKDGKPMIPYSRILIRRKQQN